MYVLAVLVSPGVHNTLVALGTLLLTALARYLPRVAEMAINLWFDRQKERRDRREQRAYIREEVERQVRKRRESSHRSTHRKP